MELDKKAQEWLDQHAVLLGPEELPLEEEKFEEAMRTREGQWPIPYAVPHMGIFADIKDEESFNCIVGNPENWPIILNRPDLYHAWIIPQAIILFGRLWFNRRQWSNSTRLNSSLFNKDDHRIARKAGTTMAETPVGKAVIFRIVSRVEHALDIYLSGGGCAKSGAIKRPGGYIIRSIANEFIQDAGLDMGYRLVRVRACPNCLGTKQGKAKHNEVKHLRDNIYSCEKCVETVRNIALVLEHYKEEGIEVPSNLIQEYKRAVCFSEFRAIVCVCPNDECQGHFVPLDTTEWSNEAQEIISKIKVTRGSQRFRNPPESLLNLPLHCPFCDEHFTLKNALASKSGFRGQSGKLAGLPSMFVWVRVVNAQCPDISSIKGALVDDSNIDPSYHIMAKQRINILVGKLAIYIQTLGNKTAPSIISRCFFEVVSEWMLTYPEDASRYFFDWSTGERESTSIELKKTPNCNIKKTTVVIRGHETSIHQTILYAWLKKISEHMCDIRRAKGSKIQSLEDLKWFCHPPIYKGGPRTTFTAIVENGLRIPNNNRIVANNNIDKPRLAWIISIQKIESDGKVGPELISFMKACEWQGIRMAEQSGLKPDDKVKVLALIMPGHHCHAPLQRIIRLRTVLLSSTIDRIRAEEAGETSNVLFWQEWQKRVEAVKK